MIKAKQTVVWASLSGDQLKVVNVEDSWRVLDDGYYYKVINENNRRVTVGLNQHDLALRQDLSGYSLDSGRLL